MKDPAVLLRPLRRLHDSIRDGIVAAAERQHTSALSEVHRDDHGDTIYAIDAVAESFLDDFFEELSRDHSLVLIAEGLKDGSRVYPAGTSEGDADFRVILDPIDGTRGLMYQKRSAWILTGVAQNRGHATSLQDIEVALQTEIPLLKQHLSDQLWAVKGRGASAERHNRLTGEPMALRLQPSGAATIEHGFAMISRFFPGGRDELAALDEELVAAAIGTPQPGKALCFEDQYISTGGQLYELAAGHDRFVADLRPLLAGVLQAKGLPRSLCCHPYDLCTALIATELGVVVTGGDAVPLDAPLNVDADVAWVGYANARIRTQMEPLLQQALRSRGWI